MVYMICAFSCSFSALATSTSNQGRLVEIPKLTALSLLFLKLQIRKSNLFICRLEILTSWGFTAD